MTTYLTQEELIDEREARTELGRSGHINEYSVTWVVRVQDAPDGMLAARRAPNVPYIGQQYPYDDSAACVNLTATSVGQSKELFHVRVEYSNDPERLQLMSVNTLPPLDRLPEISWFNNRTQEVYSHAVFNPDEADDYPLGRPITNSAGAPFKPGLRRNVTSLGLRITRNEATFSPRIAASWFDKVNGNTWMGFEPGQAIVIGITANKRVDTTWVGVVYWAVTYEIHMRAKTWAYDEVLDAGDSYWTDYDMTPQGDPILPKRKAIMQLVEDPTTGEQQWQPVNTDWPLDGRGKPLKANVQQPDPSDPSDFDRGVYLKFQKYAFADFYGLNLHQLLGWTPGRPVSPGG